MKWSQVILSGTSVLGGLALIICALFIDPKGQIDPTVLVAYGEALTFSGAVFGVDYHYKNKSSSPSDDNK